MNVNLKLLPIKAHFFFFMGAMGPILPQLSVYGKELGISAMMMGTVTAILPLTFLFFKFIFGVLLDALRQYRKAFFLALIVSYGLSYSALYLVPAVYLGNFNMANASCENFKNCISEKASSKEYKKIECLCTNLGNVSFKGLIELNMEGQTCFFFNSTNSCSSKCDLECKEDVAVENKLDSTFWCFIILMSVGTILFNVVNSLSDAMCFDIIGKKYDYGQQRVWGTIGWGLTAMVSGYAVDQWSPGPGKSYAPAFIILIVFTSLDLVSCVKLKLPKIDPPTEILKDLRELVSNKSATVFLVFATISGILDGFLIYFLLWYLEDLALQTQTTNVKLIEGFVVAAETLGTEILFFAIAGRIIDKIGHNRCLSFCFLNYAIRFGLIAIVPSPWWIILVEFLMQGPTYALTYSTIVSYANIISPPGMSATTQGIVAGFDDGIGYAIGSLLGGFLYKTFGGVTSFRIFSVTAIVCSIIHFILYRTCLKDTRLRTEYSPPGSKDTTVEA